METSIILTNEISQISLLEEFTERIGEMARLPMGMVMNLNMVLEEATSNIILYGYPSHKTDTITISAEFNNPTLTITLIDRGIEFDPTKKTDADTTLSAQERPIGGLGILLIKKVMDKVEYRREDSQNILTLTKIIKPN